MDSHIMVQDPNAVAVLVKNPDKVRVFSCGGAPSSAAHCEWPQFPKDDMYRSAAGVLCVAGGSCQ